MKGLLKPAGRIAPARFVKTTTLGVAAMLLFAPCGAFAQSNATLALSPTVAKSTLLSAMDPAREITIQLTLPLSDPTGAADLVKHVSTPKDPLFRHYITAQEFATRFGANAADFAAVKAWALANGLTVQHEATARTSLTVRGNVALLERLFKTQLSNFRSPSGDEFYSASVAPTMPSEIASQVRGVIGLTGGVQKAWLTKVGKVFGENPEAAVNRGDTAGGTGVGGAYSASDLRTAYQIPTFGGVVKQGIALFEQGGVVQSDVDTYFSKNHLKKITVNQLPVDGSDLTPNGSEVEAALDVDMVVGINPDVSSLVMYIADYNTIPFSIGLVDTFDAVATGVATGGPQTLSVSYGTDELSQGAPAIDAEFTALENCATAGVTVVVSAGDQGAYGRTGTDTYPATLNVEDPGSQPLVTCVGGTSLFTGSGEIYGLETVWNELGYYPGAGATGGGPSAGWSYLNATYQGGELVFWNGGNPNYRNVPDVTAVGDPYTGVEVYSKANGGWFAEGGTSVAAPIWGGYLSIINAGGEYVTGFSPFLGFLNPSLYYTATNFYGDEYTFPAGYLQPVVEGTNGNFELYGTAGYEAGYYYNDCAGLGSIFGPYAFQQITDIVNASPPGAPTNVVVKPSKTSAKISWTAGSGASGYAVVVILQNFSAYGQTTVTKKTSVDLTGLFPGQPYYVVVASISATGATQSSEGTFTTP